METRTIYLPQKLIVDISAIYNADNVEVSFNWNRSYTELPYDKEKRDRMDGFTLEKNNIVIKLLKYLFLAKNNKPSAILLIEKYLTMKDTQLNEHVIITPLQLYRTYLQDGLNILKKKTDFHLALIEVLELLWI